jgi:hypothetical protein
MTRSSIKNTSLPYPVLGRSNDYVGVEFQVALDFESDVAKNQHEITYEFSLSDKSITEQIEKSNATYGFEINCAETMRTDAITCNSETGHITLKTDIYYGRVLILPRVFVLKNIENYSSSHFNPEYANSKFDLSSGDILAIADDEIISFNPVKVKFSNFIQFKKSDSTDPWLYTINTNGEYIQIMCGEEVFKIINNHVHDNSKRAYMVISFYKDAVLACLDHYVNEPHINYRWVRSLKELLDSKGYSELANQRPDMDTLNSLAQEIIGTKGIKNIKI